MLVQFLKFYFSRTAKNAAALRKAILETAPKRARKAKVQ